MLMTADWVCLVVQAGGGGWAGTAANLAGENDGAHLMSAGVIIQRLAYSLLYGQRLTVTVVVTLVFCGLYAEFIYRWHNDLPAVKHYDPFATWHCGRRTTRARARVLATAPELQTPSESDKSLGAPVSLWPAAIESVEREPAHLKLALWIMGWTTLLLIVR